MNRLCFTSGCFGHTLCCSSCRCCQIDVQSFAFEEMNHRIDGRCLTGTRSSGQYHQTMPDCFHYCIFLHLVQIQFCVLFNLIDPVKKCHISCFKIKIQIMQHLRSIQLHIIIMGSIHSHPLLRLLHDDLLFHHKIHKILFHILYLYSKKVSRLFQQHVLIQIDVSFIHTLL